MPLKVVIIGGVAAALAITAGMTVDQLSKVDLCYAPPYSQALDTIITAANVARNKLDGQVAGVTPLDVKQWIEAAKILQGAGFPRVRVMDGGVSVWPFEKLHG